MTTCPCSRRRRTTLDEWEMEINEPLGRFDSLLALTRDSLYMFGGCPNYADHFPSHYVWRCNRLTKRWRMVRVVGEQQPQNVFNGCSIPSEDRLDGPLFLFVEHSEQGKPNIYMLSLSSNEFGEEIFTREQLQIDDQDGTLGGDGIEFMRSQMDPPDKVRLLCVNPNKFLCFWNSYRGIKLELADFTRPIFCIYELQRKIASNDWTWRKLPINNEQEHQADMILLARNEPICAFLEAHECVCFLAGRQPFYVGWNILSKLLLFDCRQCTFSVATTKPDPILDKFPPCPLVDTSNCVLQLYNEKTTKQQNTPPILCFFGIFEAIGEKDGSQAVFRHDSLWQLNLGTLEWKCGGELGKWGQQKQQPLLEFGPNATAISDKDTNTVYIFGGRVVKNHKQTATNALIKIPFGVLSLKEIAMDCLAQRWKKSIPTIPTCECASSSSNDSSGKFEPQLSDPCAFAKILKFL